MGLENPLHIAVIVVLLLLVFGAKRLPEIGRSLGTGMREFKQSITGESPQQPALGSGPQQQSLPASQPAAQSTPAQAAGAAAPADHASAQPAAEQQAAEQQQS